MGGQGVLWGAPEPPELAALINTSERDALAGYRLRGAFCSRKVTVHQGDFVAVASRPQHVQ